MNSRAIGLLLASHGINVNCAPMLDVRQPDADPIVGDRAYGTEPMQVAAITGIRGLAISSASLDAAL